MGASFNDKVFRFNCEDMQLIIESNLPLEHFPADTISTRRNSTSKKCRVVFCFP